MGTRRGTWTVRLGWLGLLVVLGCCTPVRGSVGSAEESLQQVLSALDRALDFLLVQHKHINLDAAIGTRVVEGQFLVLLKHLDSPQYAHVSDDIINQIRELQVKAELVSDMATPYIRLSQPHYYYRIGTLTEKGFWTLDYASRDINSALVIEPRVHGEAMHEKDSDDCLTELFGTSGKTDEKCLISPHCWKLMTSPGYQGYSLSHQVFYLEIAKQSGCLQDGMLEIADSLSAGFCANMLRETIQIAEKNYPEKRRDLFMELPALCGMLGYRQYFRDTWLEHILSWQFPNGCYGHLEPTNSGHVRVRREERNLPGGCLCHRTAVAVGALAEYVRYILEYTSQHEEFR